MKKILFPTGLLALLVVGAACASPADKGKAAAQKECDCFKIEDNDKRKECVDSAWNEYNRLLNEYRDDTATRNAIKKAYENNRDCK